jgi:hypothetical protein
VHDHPHRLELPPFTEAQLPLDPGALPAGPGVGQIVGPGGVSLVIGRAANLRRWAAGHLGGARPRKGQRPPTDLRPVAAAVRWAPTSGAFRQRLVFERLMERHTAPGARRDLKPPAFLHLDPGQRFPRLSVRVGPGRADAFGPFLRRGDAEEAAQAVNRLFALRPCDYVFEPHPELPLGLGCLYAQTQACAAPCLARVGEEAYRARAREAAGWLAAPARRGDASLPAWVSAPGEARGLVVETAGGGCALYPVRAWNVLEAGAVEAAAEPTEADVSALGWAAPSPGTGDLPWLVAWLRAPGRAAYVPVGEGEPPHAIAARARAEIMRHTR